MTMWDDLVTGAAMFACLALCGLLIAAADRSITGAARRLADLSPASPKRAGASTLNTKSVAPATLSVTTVKPIRLDSYYDIAVSRIPQRILEDIERSLGSSAKSEAVSVASLPTLIVKGARAPELGHKITKKARFVTKPLP